MGQTPGRELGTDPRRGGRRGACFCAEPCWAIRNVGDGEGMSVMVKPWDEIDGQRYAGAEPPFYSVEDFPWVKPLEENWELIRAEVEDAEPASALSPAGL